MAQYVVNIAPVPDATNETGPIPEATVRIDVEGGQVLVRELTIRAPEGAGLATAEPPYVDFELLLKAFARPAVPSDTPRRAPAPPTVEPVQETLKAPEDKPVAPRVTRSKAAPDKATASGRPASSGKRTVRAAQSGRIGPGRVYRRAPEPEMLMAAYEQTGSIAGVAAEFDVPVHTAQGWISRLRQKAAAQEPGT